MDPTFRTLRDALDGIKRVGAMPQRSPAIQDADEQLNRASAFAVKHAQALGRSDLVPLIDRVRISALAKFTNVPTTADPGRFAAEFEPAYAELSKALEG